MAHFHPFQANASDATLIVAQEIKLDITAGRNRTSLVTLP
jgi:hypothetical protein